MRSSGHEGARMHDGGQDPSEEEYAKAVGEVVERLRPCEEKLDG